MTKGLKGLNLAAGDKERMIRRAADFWNENKGLIDENLDDPLRSLLTRQKSWFVLPIVVGRLSMTHSTSNPLND